MSEFSVRDYLDHIEQAASEAKGFLENKSRAEFDADRRTQYAIIMALVIVGEAASRMSEKYPQFIAKTKHPLA